MGRSWAWAIGFFLLVLGAKLWLIGQFGSPVPDMDQWGQEAERIYKPWVEGRFGIEDLFVFAGGVHQRLWSRVFAIALLSANGDQWDPLVQQIVQAALHAAVMAASAALVARRLEPHAASVSLAVLAVCLVFPFSWRSTLWGFESHFYFLIGFSILALFGLTLHAAPTAAWVMGLVAGLCAVFAAGSGFVAGMASAATAVGLALGRRRSWRSVVPTVAAGTALVGLGLWLISEGMARNAASQNNFQLLRTQSAEAPLFALLANSAAVLSAIGNVLGWPLPSAGVAGWLMYAPLAVFTWLWLRGISRSSADDGVQRLAFAETLLVALGIWAFLQAAGLSVLRDGVVAARHRDLVSFGPWVNALALLCLLRDYARRGTEETTERQPRGLRALGAAGAALWLLALALGFLVSGREVWFVEIPQWQRLASARLENARLFLATDEPAHLEDKPRDLIPHPSPELLVRLLRDRSVRRLLPPALRDPLQLEPSSEESAAGTWVTAGVPPSLVPASPSPGLAVVGSYATTPGRENADSAAALRWRSEPIVSRATALQFALAGSVPPAGGGLLLPFFAVRLVDAVDGTTLRELSLQHLSPRAWREVRVRSPGVDRAFRIEALAPAEPSLGWLALAAPKEVGPLGYWLVPLTTPSAAAGCVLLGAGLLLLSVLPPARPEQGRPVVTTRR